MDVGVFIVFTLRRKGDEMDKADLTQYDLSGAQLTRFEIKPKDKSITCVCLKSFTMLSANAPPARGCPINGLSA